MGSRARAALKAGRCSMPAVPMFEIDRARSAPAPGGENDRSLSADRNVAHGQCIAGEEGGLGQLRVENAHCSDGLAPVRRRSRRGSRFSDGVRINPQNIGLIAGAATESCQSIQLLARGARSQIRRLQASSAVSCREIAHDRIGFPQHKSVLFQRGDETIGIHSEVGGLVVLPE